MAKQKYACVRHKHTQQFWGLERDEGYAKMYGWLDEIDLGQVKKLEDLKTVTHVDYRGEHERKKLLEFGYIAEVTLEVETKDFSTNDINYFIVWDPSDYPPNRGPATIFRAQRELQERGLISNLSTAVGILHGQEATRRLITEPAMIVLESMRKIRAHPQYKHNISRIILYVPRELAFNEQAVQIYTAIQESEDIKTLGMIVYRDSIIPVVWNALSH